jgi:hypothetical protein
MQGLDLSPERVKREAEEHAERSIERLARAGFAVSGVLYIVVGLLATEVALGRGGEMTDAKGALQTIAQRRFGSFLLLLMIAGLIGYALWRFAEAWFDPLGKGDDAKGLFQRVGYALAGVAYLGLAASAVGVLRGAAGKSSSAVAQGWTARLLGLPFGRVLVGCVGLGVIGFGLWELYQAATTRFRRDLKQGEMRGDVAPRLIAVGQAGLAAHGVVFGLIGGFLVVAALHADAAQAHGLDQALQALAQQPHGKLLLGVVAIGLMLYGGYMLISARYRRIVVR